MNLGKLLAAGQSIMNGRADVSYRSNKQVYLPKFGPGGNPFKSEAAPAEAQPVRSEMEKPMAAPVSKSQPQATRVAAVETHDAMAVADTVVVTQKAIHPVLQQKKKGSWAEKLNPISIFKAAPAKAGMLSGAAAGEPMAMQTELSLDSVRVVHNDLSDVDVEVVPMKSRPATESKPGKSSWEVLGERLFGVEPT